MPPSRPRSVTPSDSPIGRFWVNLLRLLVAPYAVNPFFAAERIDRQGILEPLRPFAVSAGLAPVKRTFQEYADARGLSTPRKSARIRG